MSLSRSVALYLGGSSAVLYVLYKVVTPSEDEMRKVLNILGLLQYCYIVKFKSLCPSKMLYFVFTFSALETKFINIMLKQCITSQ